MHKFVILLVCTAGIVSAGVLDIQRRQDNSLREGIGTRQLSQLTHQELLQQKFILDILQHVHEPLVNEELLALAHNLVVDPQQYSEGIDDEMLHVIELDRNQRLLGRHEVFTIANEEHLRQMIGLYRLLVRSRNWDTLQRNICHARMHVNGVLLVNSLLLAIRDRDDTQRLVVPALHEILPELYHSEDVIRRARNIDMNSLINGDTLTESQRPGILDMINTNRRQRIMNSDAGSDSMQGGHLSLLDRTKLWMPWRQMHVEMRARKTAGDPVTRMSIRSDDRIVLPVEQRLMGDRRMALLTEDVGLKSFLHELINDLCLKATQLTQDGGRRILDDRQQMGRVGLERNIGSKLEREGIEIDVDNARRSVGRLEADTENNRIIHIGRRRKIDDDEVRSEHILHNDNIMGARQVLSRNDNVDELLERQIDERRKASGIMDNGKQQQRQQRIINTHAIINQQNIDLDSGRIRQVNQLPTTTIDDPRLLHINRRRFHFTGDDRDIALKSTRNQFLNIIHGGKVHDGRRVVERERGMMDVGDETIGRREREGRTNTNTQKSMQTRLVGQQNIEEDRWDARSRGQQQQQTYQSNNFPTVAIDEERLLHIGRRLRQQQEQQDMQGNSRRRGIESENDSMERGGALNVIRGRNQNGRQNRFLQRDDDIDNIGKGMGTHQNSIRKTDQQRQKLNDDDMDLDMEVQSQRRRIWQGVQRGMENIGAHVSRMTDIDSTRRRVLDINDKEQLDTQRRVDTDDDENRRTVIGDGVRRRTVVNDDDDQIQDSDRAGMWHRRLPRSLMDNQYQNIGQQRAGELLLHNIQQLVARISMERISLGLTDESQRINNPRLVDAAGEREALRLNEMRLDTPRNRMLLDRINEIERRLQSAIDQEVRRTVEMGGSQGVGQRDEIDVDRVIGEVLMGKRVEGISMLNILREIIPQTEVIRDVQSLTQLGVNLQDPVLLHLLGRIVQLVDRQRQQQLGRYRQEDLQLNGVIINDVVVDRLQTYVDSSDMDLINLLDSRVSLGANRNQMQRMLVARQQRLNHKSFTINVDVNSDRNQRVVVRTLLGPQVDATGREAQLDERRQNFMLLDATVVDLTSGRNVIKRKSRDIEWSTADTTPLTTLYQRVMLAIDGDLDITQNRVQGQNCRFPDRLLLPRGRVAGLPMQMLVIVSPIQDNDRLMQQEALDNTICGIGMGSLHLDRKPLGFPLDRQIDDVQQMLALPNVHLANVKIYHDDKN